MKILFDHPLPFALAHGGFQIQIEQTMAGLARIGVEVEQLRWWDPDQRGDVIHYFGRPSAAYVGFAHAKQIKVVVAELHSGMGSRSAVARSVQKAVMNFAQLFVPPIFTSKLGWETYKKADAFIAGTPTEARLIEKMFDANPARIHVVPNGVEAVFSRPHVGGPWLVCTAAIHPRKRVAELASAAAQAQVPVWIIGKSYDENEEYHQRFLRIQRENPDWVRYEGAVSDREALAQIYAEARGFVLLSTHESLSLSSFEAASAGCPLLLSDLPWARDAFGGDATYVSARREGAQLAQALKDFYERAPGLTPTFRPLSWEEVGALFAAIYEQILRG